MLAVSGAWLLAAETGTHEFHFSLKPLLDDFGVPLALVGMFMVFFALAVVVLFITFLPRLINHLDRWLPAVVHSLQASASAPEKKNKKEDEGEDADAQLMVVIAAAVAVAVSEPHRIVFARGTSDNLAWAREGRRQVQTSHRLN